MATALKLKADIKNLKAAINSKATPKSYLPKLKAQLEKAENELESVQKGGKPRKTSTTKKTATTLSALQKLIKKKEFSIYKNSGVDLKKDAGEGAMKTGRRVSKGLKSNQYGSAADNKGNVYYEYRPNRIDVKQPKRKQTYPKLADGGMMEGGGMVDGADGFKWHNFGAGDSALVKEENKLGTIVKAYGRKFHLRFPDGSMKTYDAQDLMFLQDEDEYAKGGELKPYLVWVSKDGYKREKYGEYKSERAAKMAMKKIWESGEDYKEIGNLPKKEFEKYGFFGSGGMMAKGGKMFPHKIVLTKPNGEEIDVATFAAQGDAFSCANHLTNSNSMSYTYEVVSKKADGGELHRTEE